MRNYRAFISYNHGDERIARKLHRRIESFRPSKRLTPRPRRIQPVFRDRDEMAAATDLPDKVTTALQNSENLIVLCSPRSAASEWVNREVATFADMHGPDRIFPVIVEGEAPACFPPALLDSTPNPLAADLQEDKDGFTDGALKLIAALLPAPYGEVKNREVARARRRTRITGGLAAVFALLLVAAVVFGFRAVEETRRANAELTRAEAAILTLVQGIEEIVDQVAAGAETGKITTGVAAGLLATAEGMAERAIAQAPDNPRLNEEYGDLLVQLSRHYERAGDTQKSREAASQARAVFDRLTKEGGSLLYQQLMAIGEQADAAIANGDLDGALGHFQVARNLLRDELTRDGSSLSAKNSLSIALTKIGNVKRTKGDLKGALVSFEEGLALARDLVDLDPGNAAWARNLSVSLDRIGDARVAQGNLKSAQVDFEESLAIARDLAVRDPTNTVLTRDVSISLNKIGDVLVTQGDLIGALKAYEEALLLIRDLTNRDPGNVVWARGLTIALERIGEVRNAQGNLTGALGVYEEALALAREVADHDPENAERVRDISVLLEKVGNIRRAQGDPAGALEVYEESLALARDLTRRNPRHAEWVSDVSASLNKVGNLLASQGDLTGASEAFEEGLMLVRRLANNDPGNAELVRNVTVSLLKIGDVRRAQGDLIGAMANYEEALALRRRLSISDPDNAEWTRDIAVSLNKVGDVLVAQGDLPGAVALFKDGLAISRDLAGRDADNAKWSRDVVVSLIKMAEADPANSKVYLIEALERFERMQTRGVLAPKDAPFLEALREFLAD